MSTTAMNIEQFLNMLEQVKPTRRGWKGRCPAHDDRHPSLSINSGDRGILVKCWAGCTVTEIASALGIRVADLFFDNALDFYERKAAVERRRIRRAKQERAESFRMLQADLCREASRLIAAATSIEITCWTADQVDMELNVLADAYDIVAQEKECWYDL